MGAELRPPSKMDMFTPWEWRTPNITVYRNVPEWELSPAFVSNDLVTCFDNVAHYQAELVKL